MQCFAMTSKYTRCKITAGKWYEVEEGQHYFLCDQYHSHLAEEISAMPHELFTTKLAYGPQGNRDDEVNLADYKDKALTDLKDQIQATNEAAANSPLAQAYVNKEPLLPNQRRLASGTIVSVSPQGKAFRATIERKPSTGKPRVVEQKRIRTLASGKKIYVDSAGRMVGYVPDSE